MAPREEDLISQAMAYTDKEIFEYGMHGKDGDDAGPLDDTGDRSPEDMGPGLEGQQEPDADESESEQDEDEAAEGDAAEQDEGREQDEQAEEGEEAEDGEEGEEGEGEEASEDQAAAAPEAAPPTPQGRVPSGRLREQTERAER